MKGPIEISLDTIANGAALEEFQIAYRKVMDNIADLSTKAETKRKLTLVFDFSPVKDRGRIGIAISSDVKLAKREAAETGVYSHVNEKGENIAVHDMNDYHPVPGMQEEEKPNNVTEIKERKLRI